MFSFTTKRYDDFKHQLDDSARIAAQKAKEIGQTKSWAAAFHVSSFETQRMILARLVERVTVGSGYRIGVKFRLTVDEFLGEKNAQ